MKKENALLSKTVSDALSLFENVTGIPTQIIVHQDLSSRKTHMEIPSFCKWFNEFQNDKTHCRNLIAKAGKKAAEFGGKHIFICNNGFIHFVAPVFSRVEHIATVTSAPLLITPAADKVAKNMFNRFSVSPSLYGEMGKRLSEINYVPLEKINSMAELLYILVSRTTSIDAEKSSLRGYFKAIEKEFPEIIAAGNETKVLTESRNILENILSSYLNDKITAKNLCFEFALILSQIAAGCGKKSGNLSGNLEPLLQRLIECTELSAVRTCMLDIIAAFIDSAFFVPPVKHTDAIDNATDYIKQNYMRKITLEDVAANVYLSPSYLSKLFKTATGKNFNSYLNTERIEQAKQLLLSGSGDLESVAMSVGYEDQSYFTKVFKRLTGVTPKKFKSANGVISK